MTGMHKCISAGAFKLKSGELTTKVRRIVAKVRRIEQRFVLGLIWCLARVGVTNFRSFNDLWTIRRTDIGFNMAFDHSPANWPWVLGNSTDFMSLTLNNLMAIRRTMSILLPIQSEIYRGREWSGIVRRITSNSLRMSYIKSGELR